MTRVLFYYLLRIFSFLVVISFLLPAVKIGGFGMKLDLFFLFPLLLFVTLIDREIGSSFRFRTLILITVLLFVNMLLSGSLGIYYLQFKNTVYFPTEFIQVFNRTAVFYCFFAIGYYEIVSISAFKKLCTTVFLLGLGFGLLQSLDIGIVKAISSFYALSDTQLRGFESTNQRGFGVAGNILTWGGLSGFMLYYFYYLSDHKLIKLIGCSLALLNISLSVSRSAIISLIVSFVLINFVVALYIKKSIRSFVKVAFLLITFSSIVFYLFTTLFPERYELVLMRFSYMDQALNETGRGAQRSYFLNLMNSDYSNYLLGIGKPTLDKLGYMEMEPLFLLVAYGIVGLVLHYLLVFFSLSSVLKEKHKNNGVFEFVVGASIFYLIFSLGFFFMRESYSGLIYWIIMGYLLGYSQLKNEET